MFPHVGIRMKKRRPIFFFSFLFYSFFFLLSFFIIRESSANKKSERARYGLYGGQIPMDRFCPRIIIIIISRSKPPWWNMVGDTAYNNNEIIRNKRAWHDRKKKKEITANLNKEDTTGLPCMIQERKFRAAGNKLNCATSNRSGGRAAKN